MLQGSMLGCSMSSCGLPGVTILWLCRRSFPCGSVVELEGFGLSCFVVRRSRGFPVQSKVERDRGTPIQAKRSARTLHLTPVSEEAAPMDTWAAPPPYQALA